MDIPVPIIIFNQIKDTAMSSENHNHHITPYKTHWIVLGVLLFLTFITVWIAQFDFKMLTVAVALGVATIKATVVALYFMHLKFDSKVLGIFFALVMIVYAAVIVLTFFDYLYR